MTDRITFNVGMSVADGPIVAAPAATSYIDAEAWDKVEKTIAKDTGPINVIVQPSALSQLQALLIISDFYNEGGDLSFTVDDGVVSIPLTGPLMLIGAGAISTLMGITCNVLKFTNASVTTDANLTIFAVRSAIELGM